MQITITTIKLFLETPLSLEDSDKIRGYFAKKFEKNTLFHNIKNDGSYIYRYPRIQYKILDHRINIVGVEEGSADLESIWLYLEDEINLGKKTLAIFDSSISTHKVHLGDTDTLVAYEFKSPWLALNVKNYNKYNRIGDVTERKNMLAHILVGNLISMSKSLNYRVTGKLICHDLKFKEHPCKLKSVDMLGFMGAFSVNFLVPDLLGIGMSVSRGFGTINKTFS